MPRYTPRPPKTEREASFPGRDQDTDRCPACEENGFLNADGSPRRRPDDREPLRPTSQRVPRAPRMTAGCEVCGGTGAVAKVHRGHDPYEDVLSDTAKTMIVKSLKGASA